MSYYISPADEKVRAVCKAAFPDYTGNKCKVTFETGPINMSSYWDGGSRDYFAVVRLVDCKVVTIPQQSAYDRRINGLESFEIPAGFVVVERSIFCGKDLGLTIHARPDGSQFLPAESVQLSTIQAHVLIATKALKPSYAGISDYRAHRLMEKFGYSREDIFQAREELKRAGLLNKAGAITTAGRNAIESHPDRFRVS